jgi:hypothetical protein
LILQPDSGFKHYFKWLFWEGIGVFISRQAAEKQKSRSLSETAFLILKLIENYAFSAAFLP